MYGQLNLSRSRRATDNLLGLAWEILLRDQVDDK